MLVHLVLTVAMCTAVARAVPSLDDACAWIVAVVLIDLAGNRTGGFDYDEYLVLIDSVNKLAGEDLLVQVYAAKDPLFLLAIRVAGLVSPEPGAVFMLVAVVAVACKVLATAPLKGFRTVFIGLYAVLLAPGLEFAAIRGALAIGILLLAFRAVGLGRVLLFLVAIAGHLSILLVALSRIFVGGRRFIAMVIGGLLAAGLPFLIALAREDPRFDAYFGNRGTLLALVLPVSTLVIELLAWRGSVNNERSGRLATETGIAALTCIIAATVLALPYVTVAFRILEIGWTLMLFQVVSLVADEDKHDSHGRIAAAIAMSIAMLAAVNVYRGTWAMMLLDVL